MAEKYKIIVVDDHKIFIDGFKLLIKKIGNVEVIGEAKNGLEFQSLENVADADLVFMDINMPVMDGPTATEKILQRYPDLKIVALSTFSDNEHFNKMLYAGVEGFLLKSSEAYEFEKAINKVVNGGNYFSEELLTHFTKNIKSDKTEQTVQSIISKLTKREIDVLKLICKGYSNNEIGDSLNISARTVEKYKTSLIEKTECRNTINLVIFAFTNKIIKT